MNRLISEVKRLLARLGVVSPPHVMYIGGSDILPPPLERDMERDVLERMAAGDQGARAQLIEHNLRLVVYIARRFENTGINIEDLISIGTIGLIKAINTFRLDKNIKLATYASRCIENEILMYLRKCAREKTEVSLDEPLHDVECQLLFEALQKLNDREKLIIAMRYGLGRRREYTQKEVADRLGISQSYISRLEKRIMGRLRKELVSQI